MRSLILLAAAACSAGPTVEQGVPDATAAIDVPALPVADAATDAALDTTDAGPPPPRRIVAIGDLHGDFGSTKEAFRVGGVLAADDTWNGGTTVVVQVGDQLDRGTDEKEILDFLDAIQAQARAAGGDVIVVNGNHELMNVAGNFNSVVDQEGFDDFGGIEGRRAAFAPGGPYALRLAERPLYTILDGTVFLHGGVLPEHVPDLATIDAASRAWMKTGGPKPAVVTDPDGLVWTRLYGEEETEAACDAAEAVLNALHLDRMVVGHTIQDNGITSICDGRVWRVDVALSDYYLPHSPPTQVLQIQAGEVTILELAGKRKVTRPSSPPPARR
jgi:Calcineurin-like phosphoesterase